MAFAFEIAKSGILSHQRAIDVTGQNIANANNEAYHRQRVVMAATTPLHPLSFSSPVFGNQVGTGVLVKEVERMKDQFLENRIMQESQSQAQFEKTFDILHQIELIYNEPSDNSLRTRLDEFWSALQDVSNNPEDISIRAVLRERGVALTEILGTQYDELNRLAGDVPSSAVNQEFETLVGEINGRARELAEIQPQIEALVQARHNPNDLLDRRDQLIKELSEYIDVSVTDTDPDNIRVSVAGFVIAQSGQFNELETRFNSDGTKSIYVKETQREIVPGNGALKALADARTVVRDHLTRLKELAMTIVDEVNNLHRVGFGLDGSTGVNFFEEFDETSSGIYKITGTTQVGEPDLALNGGLYSTVALRNTQLTINDANNLNGAVTGGNESISINDLFGGVSAITYNADVDSLEDIVDKINFNVLGGATDRTGAVAKIVDDKLIVEGVFEFADSGNLLQKLGVTPQNENFEQQLPDQIVNTSQFLINRGVITINNYSISYDGNTDTINDVIKRINDARAGAQASLDESGRFVLRASGSENFKIQELDDSGDLLFRLGILDKSTTFESSPNVNSGGDRGQSGLSIDAIANRTSRGAVGTGRLFINGIDVFTDSTPSGLASIVGFPPSGDTIPVGSAGGTTGDVGTPKLDQNYPSNTNWRIQFVTAGTYDVFTDSPPGTGYALAGSGDINSDLVLNGVHFDQSIWRLSSYTIGSQFDFTTGLNPPATTLYDSVESLEQMRTVINDVAALHSASFRAFVTEDNRLLVDGVTSWEDTGNLSNVLGVGPRSKRYLAESADTDDFILGEKTRPPKSHFVSDFKVSNDVMNDLRKIAAASGVDTDLDGVPDVSNGPGSGDMMLRLAALKTARLMDANTTTVDEFVGSMVSSVAVAAKVAQDNAQTEADVITNLEALAKSVSGVSLDEEMANLMKFQRGFQASARLMTVADEMTQVILGMVG